MRLPFAFSPELLGYSAPCAAKLECLWSRWKYCALEFIQLAGYIIAQKEYRFYITARTIDPEQIAIRATIRAKDFSTDLGGRFYIHCVEDLRYAGLSCLLNCFPNIWTLLKQTVSRLNVIMEGIRIIYVVIDKIGTQSRDKFEIPR